jgi:hypothetical protein
MGTEQIITNKNHNRTFRMRSKLFSKDEKTQILVSNGFIIIASLTRIQVLILKA